MGKDVIIGELHSLSLKNAGTLEKAAAMANHASTRTTQLYDPRRDEVSLDEVERSVISKKRHHQNGKVKMQITDLVPLCRKRVMKMAGPDWNPSSIDWEAMPPTLPLSLQSYPNPTISALTYANVPPITNPKYSLLQLT